MDEEGILNDWKKKMLMNVTTMTAKMIASSQSRKTLGFCPSLYLGFQKVQLTFFVTHMSKTTIRPRSHQGLLSQITQRQYRIPQKANLTHLLRMKSLSVKTI